MRRLERLFRAVHVDAQAADAEVKQRAAVDPIAVALDGLVGIGPVMALTIRTGRRHPTLCARSRPRQLCGVGPRGERSADHVYHGRITRDGSPWLRWALVQAALHAMKRDDGTGRWARRLAVRKGIANARVALAPVLCEEIVATWPRTV